LSGCESDKKSKSSDSSEIAKAKADIARLYDAVKMYYMDNGRLPEELTDLVAGGIIKHTRALKDPWGNEYYYSTEDESARKWNIYSLGADGEVGGEGDDKDISSNDL
jgi:general secretion pathway protein G